MEAFGYSLTPTRDGLEGMIDKIVLIEDMSDKYSQNRELQDIVLKAIEKSESGADEQLKAWEKFLESLPYRREAGEILRNPVDTAKYGGDCDDLVVLALAGAKAIGLPGVAEVVADSKHNGFHVRALVGLPPLNPTFWVVIDPVCWSEPKWAMIDKNPTLASQQFNHTVEDIKGMSLQGMNKSLRPSLKMGAVALTLIGIYLISKKLK